MISKSIERAQKKVEENNFGIRKRLLEYDDVMNKQRNVVYAKRNHALFGERLALDLDNAYYSVAEGLVLSYRESFSSALRSVLSMSASFVEISGRIKNSGSSPLRVMS